MPAFFWADGEDPLLVTVRRKSADPLNNGGGFIKVSLKIDVNALVNGQKWRDLIKLSLENGDDQDVLSEGVAWQLHRFASGPEGYGYSAGMMAWVRLIINGVDTGVYVNVEQRNKQFLRNRGLYTPDETWLYKVGDNDSLELKVGTGESPAVGALCYPPFRPPSPECPPPDAATLAVELPQWIDMRGMMALATVNTYTGNPTRFSRTARTFISWTFSPAGCGCIFPGTSIRSWAATWAGAFTIRAAATPTYS